MRLTAAGSRPVGSPAGDTDLAEGSHPVGGTDRPAAGSPVEDSRPAGNHPGGSHLAGGSPAAGRNRTGRPSR